MFSKARSVVGASIFIATLAGACGGSTPETPPDPVPVEVGVNASAQWNDRAIALVVARPPSSNGQAAVSRILTYVSLAQYRAVTAARAVTPEPGPFAVSAAVGGASVAVLNALFPLDVAATEALLSGDRAAQSPAGSKESIAAGEALGRQIGAAVVAQVAMDNYLTASPGVPPVGPGMWTSSSAALVPSLHGTRPFFMTSADQLRAPAPPAFDSPQFLAALAEVRQISDTRTADQIAIANAWNVTSGPFTAGTLNRIAADLIRENHSTEQEAARILAFANAAAFDAQIACWDSKFTYWLIRPAQADPGITMPIGLPNHPSYPSGHSCITGAFMAVLSDALPNQRTRLDAMVVEAGLSRVYGGIHYRFDIETGRDMGRAAAALALKGHLD
jgi:membrane-associated phospholipid phosphatase